MKALVFKENLEFVANYPIPQRNTDEALIKVKLAGICNTDREVMKGYKDFHGVLGHEFVGVIEDANDKSLIGKRVVAEINIGCGECDFCKSGMVKHCLNRKCLGLMDKDGYFSEYITMPLNTIHFIDDDISDEDALFTEPLAAAFSAVKDANIQDDENILLIGDGRLSFLIYTSLVYALKGRGKDSAYIKSHVMVKGRHSDKLKLFGEATVTDDISSFKKHFDAVFEASGSDSGIDEAINCTKPRGRIIIKTTRAGKATIDLNAIVVNELKLIGSRCGDFKDALMVLKAHPHLPKTEFFPLEQFKEAFDLKAFKVGFKF